MAGCVDGMAWGGVGLNLTSAATDLCLPSVSFVKGIDTLPSGERVGYNNMIYHEHEVCVCVRLCVCYSLASPALPG